MFQYPCFISMRDAEQNRQRTASCRREWVLYSRQRDYEKFDINTTAGYRFSEDNGASRWPNIMVCWLMQKGKTGITGECTGKVNRNSWPSDRRLAERPQRPIAKLREDRKIRFISRVASHSKRFDMPGISCHLSASRWRWNRIGHLNTSEKWNRGVGTSAWMRRVIYYIDVS